MKPLPANVRQDIIIERTDGVPLFVEEMTKAVLETQQSCFMAGPIVWPVATSQRRTVWSPDQDRMRVLRGQASLRE